MKHYIVIYCAISITAFKSNILPPLDSFNLKNDSIGVKFAIKAYSWLFNGILFSKYANSVTYLNQLPNNDSIYSNLRGIVTYHQLIEIILTMIPMMMG